MIPGPKSRQLARRLRHVESRNVTYLSKDFPVFWESAAGAWIRDVDGNQFLDLTSAFAVASLGHSPSVLQRVIQKQSKRMWHGMGDIHPNSVKVQLLEALASVTPGGLSVSILSSSGAEAVESALKTARLYTGKPGVIAFDGAYHGLTYGTLAVTRRPDFKDPFRDQIPSFAVHLPYPDSLRGPTEEECLERVEQFLKNPSRLSYPLNPSPLAGEGGRRPDEGVSIRNTTPHPLPQGERELKSVEKGKVDGNGFGAILVEPIQGRGGIRIPRPFFLKELKTIAKHHGLLLIADEIFTGFGRTGRMFAVDRSGVVPDLLCVGKALANGFPISACIGRRQAIDAWPPSDGEAIHTSTFLGNPLGCAMGLASVEELRKRKLAQRSARLGKQWLHGLRQALGDHPRVGEIRGQGLMIGIEIVKDRESLEPDPNLASRMLVECLRRGLIILSGGTSRNVITLTPPLVISEQALAQGTQIMKRALTAVESAKMRW